ncbi:DUF4232 domain-containing protein [Streptomyces axinellae]|uniref:DUF4232 domain-containing protein n=1 Tax=Streptomyces axinellae TaxID=552788 RepID=A0ABP6C5P1_9ACTN
MKHTRTTAFAAVGLVAVLSLTACGNDDGKKDSSAKSASSSDKGSSSSGDAKTGDVKSDSGKDTSTRTGSGTGSASHAKKGKFCRTADLAMDAQDTSPDAETGDVTVTMINRGSTTCSATGFAGLDITDADHTTSPIERAKNQPRITNLKPGDAASFNVSFKLAANGEGASKPTELVVTPPNETHSVKIKWPSGEMATPYADDSVEVHPVGLATN